MPISKNSEKLNRFIKPSKDLFAEAVIQMYEGKPVNFGFKFQTGEGEIKQPHDLSRYLRNDLSHFPEIEKRLINLCCGRILDVGAGTGNYLPLMAQKGDVVGLEISPALVKFGHKIFTKDLVCADFFTYDFGNAKFDTITFMENNLGICQTTERLDKMIKIFDKILDKKGQILIMTKRFNRQLYSDFYNKVTLVPYLNTQTGQSFDWITFDEEYLKKMFLQRKFLTQELYEENGNLLLKINY